MRTQSVCSGNNISNEISVIQSMCYITHFILLWLLLLYEIFHFVESFHWFYTVALLHSYIARINTYIANECEWERLSEKKKEKEEYRRFHWDIKIIIPTRISCSNSSSNSNNSSQCSNMLDVMIKFSEIRAWCVCARLMDFFYNSIITLRFNSKKKKTKWQYYTCVRW